MKERPILYTGEMVRAILEDRKTETRRIAKLKPLHAGLNFGWTGLEPGYYATDVPSSGWVLRARRGDGCWEDKTHRTFCPYGQPGDRLWVRETWQRIDDLYGTATDLYKADDNHRRYTDDFLSRIHWTPAIFMPRWASRITLEIVSTRLERLHAITENDALAEGVARGFIPLDTISKYAFLWDKINAKRGYPWDSNPWVWVIEFKRV